MWPSKGLRRVSVNSFGASGTNAHVILDDAYHYLSKRGLTGNHCTLPETPFSTSSIPNGLHPIETPNDTPTLITGDFTESQSGQGSTPRLLLLSASDKPALQRMVQLYDEWLRKWPDHPTEFASFLHNLSHTLASRRSLLPTRSFAVVDSHASLSDLKSRLSPPVRTLSQPNVAFVFTGQGAQWAGMGRELLKFPTFERNLLESQSYLSELGCSWNLIGI